MKANGDRVIITAEWLLDQYRGKGLTLEMLTYLISPFLMEDPMAEWDIRINEARYLVEEKKFDHMTDASKADYIEMWELFKSGWRKMTVFEQQAVKKKLLPLMCERAMKGELL